MPKSFIECNTNRLDLLNEWDTEDDSWKKLVEPEWLVRAAAARSLYVPGSGSLPDNFLLTSIHGGNYGFFQDWGCVLQPRKNHLDEYNKMKDNFIEGFRVEDFSDPKFGGLRRWFQCSWANIPDDTLPLLPLPLSPTTIHHLWVIFQWLLQSGITLSEVDSIAHWGGGFGNQSRIFRTLGLKTEYVIDLPVVSLLQYDYLRNALGEDAVHLVAGKDHDIKPGTINCVPLPFADRVPKVDIFIAFHSLNESTVAAQHYVMGQRKWFGAKYVVVASTPGLLGPKGVPFGEGSLYWDKHFYEFFDGMKHIPTDTVYMGMFDDEI